MQWMLTNFDEANAISKAAGSCLDHQSFHALNALQFCWHSTAEAFVRHSCEMSLIWPGTCLQQVLSPTSIAQMLSPPLQAKPFAVSAMEANWECSVKVAIVLKNLWVLTTRIDLQDGSGAARS